MEVLIVLPICYIKSRSFGCTSDVQGYVSMVIMIFGISRHYAHITETTRNYMFSTTTREISYEY